jgi:hypothetical protein
LNDATLGQRYPFGSRPRWADCQRLRREEARAISAAKNDWRTVRSVWPYLGVALLLALASGRSVVSKVQRVRVIMSSWRRRSRSWVRSGSSAEVSVTHTWIAADLGGPTRRDDLASIEDVQARADSHYQFHVVLD